MTRIISLVLVALATWTLGCAGDTSAPLNSIDADFFTEDAEIPPGADDPHPPDSEDASIFVPEPDTTVDPCAPYREWIKEGVVYMCTYECGGRGPCTPTFSHVGGCAVDCNPEFYVIANTLGRDGDNMIYKMEDCPATCVPVQ